MKEPVRGLRLLVKSLESISRFGGYAFRQPDGFRRGLQNLLRAYFNGRIPWIRRQIAYLSSEKQELVTYHYRLGGAPVVTATRPLTPIRRHWPFRSIPAGPLVVGWENYLVRELQFDGVKEAELKKAAPYQLSLISPFEPDEVCFALKIVDFGRNGGTVLNYSHLNEISSMISRLPVGSFYPTEILAEDHIWEAFLLQQLRHPGLPMEECYLYIRFSDSAARFGMLGSCLWPSRTVRLDGEKGNAWLEQVYNAMLSFLADFSTGYPESKLSGILLGGDDHLNKHFAQRYAHSLPAPARAVPTAPDNVGAEKQLSSKGSRNHAASLCYAIFAVDRKSLPRLEPAATLRGSFRRPYCKSRLLRLVVLLILAIIAWFVTEWSTIHNLERRLAAGQLRITHLAPSVKRLLALQAELDRADESGLEPASVLDILTEIRLSQPDGLHFTSLHYARGNRLSLRGSSASVNDPVQFVKDLKKCPFFTDVLLAHLSKKKDDAAARVEFLIEVILNDD